MRFLIVVGMAFWAAFALWHGNPEIVDKPRCPQKCGHGNQYFSSRDGSCGDCSQVKLAHGHGVLQPELRRRAEMLLDVTPDRIGKFSRIRFAGMLVDKLTC